MNNFKNILLYMVYGFVLDPYYNNVIHIQADVSSKIIFNKFSKYFQ